MQFIFVLLSIALSATVLNAEYTKFQWTDCGSRQVTFSDIDVTPMPILQPGKATLNFRADLKRDIVGKLKTDLNIVRSVSGIKLPIRCYIAGGVSVGSCSYTDFCTIIETLLPNSFNPSVCPPEILPIGIDCTCPFKVKKGLITVNNNVLDLPDASTTVATFLASGDFDVSIKLADDQGSLSCVNIGFSVRPNKKV